VSSRALSHGDSAIIPSRRQSAKGAFCEARGLSRPVARI
jgi:hypothetical protein